MQYQYYLILVILMISITFTIINILKSINIRKIKKLISDTVDRAEESTKKRTTEYERLFEDEGLIDKVKFKRNLDIYLIRSGLKEKYTFLNADLFLLISIVITIIVFLLSMIITKNLLLSIVFTSTPCLTLQLTLYILASKSYESVDNDINAFINALETFSMTHSDIVTIISESTQFINNPLKQYCNEFISTARTTGNTELAFAELESKLENEKLKDLLKSLEIASENNANYSEIINEHKKSIMAYFETKESKKAKKKTGQIEITTCVILGLMIIYLLRSLIPNLEYAIFHTPIGNLILAYWVVVFIIWFLYFIKLQKN